MTVGAMINCSKLLTRPAFGVKVLWSLFDLAEGSGSLRSFSADNSLNFLRTGGRKYSSERSRKGSVMGNINAHPSQALSGVGQHEYYRAEAKKHAELRNQYYEQSQEAYRRGRKAEAKALSNKGKAEAALMEKANRMASDAAFEGNNKGRDSATIDLHGLYVDEAMRRAHECIVKARAEGKEYLVFIVGKGNHSVGGVQKLKPAIEKLAREERLTCISNKPHDGCVYVILEGEGKVLDGVAAFFKGIASLFRKIFHKL